MGRGQAHGQTFAGSRTQGGAQCRAGGGVSNPFVIHTMHGIKWIKIAFLYDYSKALIARLIGTFRAGCNKLLDMYSILMCFNLKYYIYSYNNVTFKQNLRRMYFLLFTAFVCTFNCQLFFTIAFYIQVFNNTEKITLKAAPPFKMKPWIKDESVEKKKIKWQKLGKCKRNNKQNKS